MGPECTQLQAGGLPESVLSNITAQALEGLVCLHKTRHMVCLLSDPLCCLQPGLRQMKACSI